MDNFKSDKFRMEYHLTPPTGFLGDPNGLCCFRGEYHVFFQYCPGSTEGGATSWGHYKTLDWKQWEFLGEAILPDSRWDRDGAYSGSAIVEDDVLYLFYTGNVKEPGNHDYIYTGRRANVLLVTSKDGIHFSPKELLLNNEDYPTEYTCHVRDPKVFKKDDTYYMVLGGRTKQGEGQALLYESKDLKGWQWLKNIHYKKQLGYMWECPDIFFMDGIRVLMCCPQGLEGQESKLENHYLAGYFLKEDGKIIREFETWDKGFDFYSPQTFEDKKGRRILIGWLGISDSPFRELSPEKEFRNGLTLARELVLRNGQIFQKPLKEYENLRKEAVEMKENVPVTIEKCSEIILENEEKCKRLHALFCDGLVLHYENGIFVMEFLSHIGAGRMVRKGHIGNLRKVNIFLDVSSIEIFLNDGEMVFTSRVFPEKYTLSFQWEGAKAKYFPMEGFVINQK